MKSIRRCLLPFFAGLVALPLVSLLTMAGCSLSKPAPMNDTPIHEYNAAVTKAEPAASSEAEKRGLDQWKALLSNLTVDNIHQRAVKVYADRLFFNDTLKTLHSNTEVEAYLLETAKMLDHGTVEYRDAVKSADGSWYVRWEMVYQGKKLAKGQPIRTIGMSQLRFDTEGRVILHQDFWDASRGIFEHVPFVGPQVRWIKNKF